MDRNEYGCGQSAYREPQTRFAAVDFRGVSGIVSLRGRVQAHSDQVRAEHARVEAAHAYGAALQAPPGSAIAP